MKATTWRPAAAVLSLCSLIAGCGDDLDPEGVKVINDAGPIDATIMIDARRTSTVDPVDADVEECPSVFAQDILPEWRITISDEEWAALEYEFYNRAERKAAGLDANPYHPVVLASFDDGNTTTNIPQVLIRLKGQSSWVQAAELDANPKMQFVLAFNEVNPDGRFKGLRKVELDMPRSDWTFLRQRLALHMMRQIGQDAQCANNAKLYVNGEYYGLFTHLERLDKEFLQRIYGKENGVDDGDLWKAGVQIRTNKDTHSDDRIDAFWAASSVAQLEALVDLGAAVREWTAETILPHADGYHLGRPNFFLYDHPERGFTWLPTDLDTAFDYRPFDLDVAFPECSNRNYGRWVPYATILGDAYWMDQYIDSIIDARQLYEPADQVALVQQWAAQIESAALADPRKPFTMEDHQWALQLLGDYVYFRTDFIDSWLACRADGTGIDADADGSVFCFDCDDQNDDIHPGRAESCNGVDDDCDGFLDEGVQCSLSSSQP